MPEVSGQGTHRPLEADALLVDLCRRGAVEDLVARRIEPFADEPAWQGLLDLARRHMVLGLTLSVLSQVNGLSAGSGAANELASRLRFARRRAALFGMKRDQVLEALDDAGVASVVLKGTVLAATLYREPCERDLGDLDVLVRLDQLKRGFKALKARGYVGPRSLAEMRAWRRGHFHLALDGPDAHCVELHWAVVGPDAFFRLESNTIFEHRIRVVTPQGPGFYAPRPEHMLLHIVLQNLQDGFACLGRFVDLDRIVAAHPGMDWDLLCRTACAGRLGPAAALSLQLAARLLGAPVPPRVLRELLPSATARFHLAIMCPVGSVLSGRWRRSPAAKELLELWLIRGVKDRVRQWLRLPAASPQALAAFGSAPPRRLHERLRPGKTLILQALLYMRALAGLATRSARSEMRVWSERAGS